MTDDYRFSLAYNLVKTQHIFFAWWNAKLSKLWRYYWCFPSTNSTQHIHKFLITGAQILFYKSQTKELTRSHFCSYCCSIFGAKYICAAVSNNVKLCTKSTSGSRSVDRDLAGGLEGGLVAEEGYCWCALEQGTKLPGRLTPLPACSVCVYLQCAASDGLNAEN